MTFAIETWPLARIEALKTMRAAGVSAAAMAKLSQRNRRQRYASLRVRGPDDSEDDADPPQNPVAFAYKTPRPCAEKRKMYAELPPLNLTILDLTMRDGKPVECRFITNDDLANATYCGNPIDEGCSWCAHHRLALQAPPRVRVAPSLAPKIAAAA